MIDIAEHRELEAKATPGPWSVSDCGEFWRVGAVDCMAFDDGSACGEYNQECTAETRDYIVAMRNDHRALLDELEAARAFVLTMEAISTCSDSICRWHFSTALRKYKAATKGER
jgi:hypothetical protein